MSTKDDEIKPLKSNVISEKSGVQLSLVIPLFVVAVTITAGWVNLSTKIDGVIASQRDFVASQRDFMKTYASDGAELHRRVEGLERAVDKINAAGSPRLSEVERGLADLARKVEVHIESTKGKP